MIYCYYLQIISIIIRQTLSKENKKKIRITYWTVLSWVIGQRVWLNGNSHVKIMKI